MLELIDRFKFGIIAVFLCYVFIFVYTNSVTYVYIEPVEPFIDYAKIEDPDEVIQITPDNIEVPNDYDLNALNMSQNAHDDRKESYEQYSDRRSPQQIAQDIKSLEAQMKKEAGGSAERARLQQLIDQRKEDQRNAAENQTDGATTDPQSQTKYAGATMVYYDLNGRKAHNDNDWYVRNPGYTCEGSGVVIIDVKANKDGEVVSATYNAGASKNASSCMIGKALKYAKMSRFAYSSVSSHQTGYIKYTFVAE